MHISRLTECHGFLCKTALRPRENFSSGNPTKILSHLRILEQELGRAYLRLLEPCGFPRHRPLSWDKHIPGCSPLLLKALAGFSGIDCITAPGWFLAPISSTLDFGIWTTVITPLAIWVGKASVLFPCELKRVHSDSHLTSKDFVL